MSHDPDHAVSILHATDDRLARRLEELADETDPRERALLETVIRVLRQARARQERDLSFAMRATGCRRIDYGDTTYCLSRDGRQVLRTRAPVGVFAREEVGHA